ncbi:DNA cytosine methyltransferase [Streptomyces lydicus]|uniref:DNA cytosine methyltransferase n=1 Tax=Streptomyces lydicus TaxID=47763 RepID=UPI00322072FD
MDALGISDQAPVPGGKPAEGKPRTEIDWRDGCPDPGLEPVDTWVFEGRKTSAYRQVGNAFPPPVAEAVGRSIA